MERILHGCDSRHGGRINLFVVLLKLANHTVLFKGRLHGWLDVLFVYVMYILSKAKTKRLQVVSPSSLQETLHSDSLLVGGLAAPTLFSCFQFMDSGQCREVWIFFFLFICLFVFCVQSELADESTEIFSKCYRKVFWICLPVLTLPFRGCLV